MKQLSFILIIGLLILGCSGIASATINVTATNISSNYIKWEWNSVTPLTGINVDGKLVSNFDPSADSYILSNLRAEEIHRIVVYTSGDSGSNQTETAPEPTGDLPLGIWIYTFPAMVFIIVARYARVAFFNSLTVIFALFGIYQLIRVKDIMDGGLWTLSLAVYFVFIVVGLVNWAYMSGRFK